MKSRVVALALVAAAARRDGTRFFIKKPSEPEFEILPEGDFAKGNDDFFSRSAALRFIGCLVPP